MPCYVALLRGIGPSDPNMRNEKLRGVFERLGYQDVRSVLSSGNILFESDDAEVPALEGRIEEALHLDLGITSTTIIRNRQELQAVADSGVFDGREHGRESYLTVTFLKDRSRLSGDTSEDTSEVTASQASQLLGTDAVSGALYAVTDTTSTKTPDLMRQMEKTFGKDITTRTWLTVQRIQSKMPAPS
jgi:uncharacterized protein (DUF1697 family)